MDYSLCGHLVLFSCGHRGQPNRAEEKRVSRLMRKSGFIPQLEQISIERKQQEKKLDEIYEKIEVVTKGPATGPSVSKSLDPHFTS